MPIDVQWRRECAQQMPTDLTRLAGACIGAANHSELISTEPRNECAGARHLTRSTRDRDKHAITKGVPHAVIDGLEIVEIDEEHGKSLIRLSCRFEGLSQMTQQ